MSVQQWNCQGTVHSPKALKEGSATIAADTPTVPSGLDRPSVTHTNAQAGFEHRKGVKPLRHAQVAMGAAHTPHGAAPGGPPSYSSVRTACQLLPPERRSSAHVSVTPHRITALHPSQCQSVSRGGDFWHVRDFQLNESLYLIKTNHNKITC